MSTADEKILALESQLTLLQSQIAQLLGQRGSSIQQVQASKSPSLGDIPIFQKYVSEDKRVDWDNYRRDLEVQLKRVLRGEDPGNHDRIGFEALTKSGDGNADFKKVLRKCEPDVNNLQKTTKEIVDALEAHFATSDKAKIVRSVTSLGNFVFDWSKSIRQNVLNWEDMLTSCELNGYVAPEIEKYSKLVNLLKDTDLKTRVLDALTDNELTSDGIVKRMKKLGERDEMTGDEEGLEMANRATVKLSKRDMKPKSFSPGRSGTEKKFSGKCFRCKKKGHRKEDCKVNLKSTSPSDIKCFNCQMKGHKSSECTEPRKEKKEKKVRYEDSKRNQGPMDRRRKRLEQ